MLMNTSIGLAPEGMTIKEAPSFAKIPIYNFDDQQATGFPKDADALNDAVSAADGVLIVSAEYNWSMPGGPEERHRLAVALQGGVVQGQAGVHPVGGAGALGRLAHAVSPAHGDAGDRRAAVRQARGDRQHGGAKFADGKLKDQGAIDLIKQQLAAFGKFIDRVKVVSQQERAREQRHVCGRRRHR